MVVANYELLSFETYELYLDNYKNRWFDLNNCLQLIEVNTAIGIEEEYSRRNKRSLQTQNEEVFTS